MENDRVSILGRRMRTKPKKQIEQLERNQELLCRRRSTTWASSANSLDPGGGGDVSIDLEFETDPPFRPRGRFWRLGRGRCMQENMRNLSSKPR